MSPWLRYGLSKRCPSKKQKMVKSEPPSCGGSPLYSAARATVKMSFRNISTCHVAQRVTANAATDTQVYLCVCVRARVRACLLCQRSHRHTGTQSCMHHAMMMMNLRSIECMRASCVNVDASSAEASILTSSHHQACTVSVNLVCQQAQTCLVHTFCM